ncbi:MAG: hypothetical protein HC880_15005 [Bacteroidia bacterium]|nr:hypothetical protein [Bacteroidia bacterium]
MLSQYTPVHVLGGSGKWYKVSLPDQRVGYVYGSLLEPAEQAFHEVPIEAVTLWAQPSAKSVPVAKVTDRNTWPVYARYQDYYLVKDRQGQNAWLVIP